MGYGPFLFWPGSIRWVGSFLGSRSYIHVYHTMKGYITTYLKSIRPIADEKYWSEPLYEVLPPYVDVAPGRPCRNRRKGEDKNGTKSRRKCSNCREYGHNKDKCPNPHYVPPLRPVTTNTKKPVQVVIKKGKSIKSKGKRTHIFNIFKCSGGCSRLEPFCHAFTNALFFQYYWSISTSNKTT